MGRLDIVQGPIDTAQVPRKALPHSSRRAVTTVVWLVLACALASFGAAPALAQADAAAEAKRRYERALSLYEEGQFDAALVELQRAQRLRPSLTLLYNIAQVQLARQDYAAALLSFRRYLDEGRAEVTAARRSEVEAQLHELALRVARVEVEVDVGAAEILVDHQVRAENTHRASLLVNAGLRLISVRHGRFPPQHHQITVAGGDALSVRFGLRSGVPVVVAPLEPMPAESVPGSLSLQQAAGAEVSAPVAPTTPPDDGSLGLWLGWGATGVLALGAGGFGLLAHVADRDLSDLRAQAVGDPAAIEDEADRARAFAIASDACLIGAFALGALSLYWTLAGDEAADAQEDARLDLTPGGIQMRLRY